MQTKLSVGQRMKVFVFFKQKKQTSKNMYVVFKQNFISQRNILFLQKFSLCKREVLDFARITRNRYREKRVSRLLYLICTYVCLF